MTWKTNDSSNQCPMICLAEWFTGTPRAMEDPLNLASVLAGEGAGVTNKMPLPFVTQASPPAKMNLRRRQTP